MKIRNAVPQFFYGLHFQDGIAEYKDMEGSPVIYISGDTAKGMDKSFQGKPVFVMHAEEEPDYGEVHSEADGMVIRSFYNKCDGNHWAEFVVYTDDGLQAITSGMQLSNAYNITNERSRGTWHGADYDREVAGAEYEHLAIVPNPRYKDSIILTPEQFKAYNKEKEEELVRISNSKGDSKMFKIFKREAVKNSAELSEMMVTLPKSKVDKSITQLVNEADALAVEGTKPRLVNSTDMIKLDGKKISIAKFLKLHNEMKETVEDMKNEEEDELENEEDEMENEDESDMENMDEEDAENMDEEKPENGEDSDDMENEEEDDLENMDEDDMDNMDEEKMDYAKNGKRKKNSKKKNSLSNAAKEFEAARRNYNKLKNAHKVANSQSGTIMMSEDKVSRGNKRYGSN